MKECIIILISVMSLSLSAQQRFSISKQLQKCVDAVGNPIENCLTISDANGEQRYGVISINEDNLEWTNPKTGALLFSLPLPVGGPGVITTLTDNTGIKRQYTYTSEDGTVTVIQDTDVRLISTGEVAFDPTSVDPLNVLTENNNGDLFMVKYSNGVAIYSYPGTGTLYTFQFFIPTTFFYYGEFKNHADAAAGGTPIGGTWSATSDNTLGASVGTLLIRKI